MKRSKIIARSAQNPRHHNKLLMSFFIYLMLSSFTTADYEPKKDLSYNNCWEKKIIRTFVSDDILRKRK